MRDPSLKARVLEIFKLRGYCTSRELVMAVFECEGSSRQKHRIREVIQALRDQEYIETVTYLGVEAVYKIKGVKR